MKGKLLKKVTAAALSLLFVFGILFAILYRTSKSRIQRLANFNQYRAADLYFTNCFHCLIRHWGSSELYVSDSFCCNRRNVHYLRYGTCWNYPISKNRNESIAKD